MAYEPKTWVKGETVTPFALNNMENALAEANGDYVPHEWSCGEVVSAELLNHIEQGIANAGGGEEPKRVLLYENDALDFSSSTDNWLYVGGNETFDTNAWIYINGAYSENPFTLVVDDESLTAQMQNYNDYCYFIGASTPNDTEHVGVSKIGCTLNRVTGGGLPLMMGQLLFVMLDKTSFTTGTHSVKLYMELEPTT